MPNFNPKIIQPFSSDTREDLIELSERAEHYKQKLDTQWDVLKKEAGNYGSKALIIGGVTAGVYLVMNALLPREDDEEAFEAAAPQPRNQSGPALGSAIKSLIWAAALGLAKQKISDYIASKSETGTK